MESAQTLPRSGDQVDAKMLDEREFSLLEDISDTRHYYSKCARQARLFHSSISMVALIGSVIAPIAVVSSTGAQEGLALFGIGEKVIAQLAVITTIILALCEGLRRSFQFDIRWMTCVQAREQLRQLCDEYLDQKIAFVGDNIERHKRLEALRQKTYEIGLRRKRDFSRGSRRGWKGIKANSGRAVQFVCGDDPHRPTFRAY